MSSYQALREQIRDSKMGFLNRQGFFDLCTTISCELAKERKPPEPAKKKAATRRHTISSSDYYMPRRITRSKAPFLVEELDLTPELKGDTRVSAVTVRHQNSYGAIPGIAMSKTWESRMQCSADGIHRPTVAGIHGGPEGAYSIALSGGYEDDVDFGDFFTYTGEGGRDLKGTKANPKNLRIAAQTKDQTLTRGNLSLSISMETRYPVRVVRGFKLKSTFAPETGYRYDGLYRVEKFWSCTGKAGFLIYRFLLKRIPDQEPPIWCKDTAPVESVPVLEIPQDSTTSGDSAEATPSDHETDVFANASDFELDESLLDILFESVKIKLQTLQGNDKATRENVMDTDCADDEDWIGWC